MLIGIINFKQYISRFVLVRLYLALQLGFFSMNKNIERLIPMVLLSLVKDLAARCESKFTFMVSLSKGIYSSKKSQWLRYAYSTFVYPDILKIKKINSSRAGKTSIVQIRKK